MPTVEPVKENETRDFLSTAYFPAGDLMNGGFITATGRRVHSVDQARADGEPVTIAVDPRIVPYGSMLTIRDFPGLRFIAADTGGRIKGNHIDISMSTRVQCTEWGKRTITATVVSIPPHKKPKKKAAQGSKQNRVNR